jgi:hypothetical protein
VAATVLTRDISEATPVANRRRIGAAVVDWTICLVAYIVVSIPLGALESFGFTLQSRPSTDVLGQVVADLAQAATVLPIVLYFTLGLREGHTLGMAAFDFKTLDARDGRPPGTLRSVLRSLVSVVFAAAVYAAYMGHSADHSSWSRHVAVIYVVGLVLAGVVAVDKAFIPAHRSGRALTDLLFRLVRVTGAAADTDRGLSDWLDRRVSR